MQLERHLYEGMVPGYEAWGTALCAGTNFVVRADTLQARSTPMSGHAWLLTELFLSPMPGQTCLKRRSLLLVLRCAKRLFQDSRSAGRSWLSQKQ